MAASPSLFTETIHEKIAVSYTGSRLPGEEGEGVKINK